MAPGWMIRSRGPRGFRLGSAWRQRARWCWGREGGATGGAEKRGRSGERLGEKREERLAVWGEREEWRVQRQPTARGEREGWRGRGVRTVGRVSKLGWAIYVIGMSLWADLVGFVG